MTGARKTIAAKRGSTPSSDTARAYHHGNLRAELISQALAQVEQGGAEALSLNALAKALGVSQPAPYRHFTDRGALLAAVAEQGFRDFGAALHGALEGHPASRHVALLAHAYVAFARQRAQLYRLLFCSRVVASNPHDEALQEAADGAFGVLLAALTAHVRDEAQAYRTAFTAWSGLHGIVLLEQEGFLPDAAVDVDGLIEDLIATVRQRSKAAG